MCEYWRHSGPGAEETQTPAPGHGGGSSGPEQPIVLVSGQSHWVNTTRRAQQLARLGLAVTDPLWRAGVIHQDQSQGSHHRVPTQSYNRQHSPRPSCRWTRSSQTRTWPASGSSGPTWTAQSQAWPPLQRSGVTESDVRLHNNVP